MSRWVVDTSPLIYLAHLDRLELLRQSADEILVPPAVVRELQEKPDASTSKIDAARRSWLRLEAPENQSFLRVLRLELDRRGGRGHCAGL